MATRAQIVQRAFDVITQGDTPEETPWYFKEASLNIATHVAGFSADVLRLFNKPLIAGGVDTVTGLLNKRVLDREYVDSHLSAKIQEITTALQSIDKDEDCIRYARLDAQLELVMGLLNDDKDSDG